MVVTSQATRDRRAARAAQRPKHTSSTTANARTVKAFTAPLGLKAEGDPGSFRAIFSTLNVRDLDGDVTLPGAFIEGQAVKISAWSHNWGTLTVGKGTIHSNDTEAWVDGQFNLNTQAGRDHYETVKFNGADQEFSYGFDVTKWSVGDFEGQQVRFLEGLDVFEVSPVMLGAGIDTRLESIKEGRRNSTTDLEHIQAMHDHAVLLGATCDQADGDPDEDPNADEENADGKASKRGNAKAKAGSTEILATRVALELLELDT